MLADRVNPTLLTPAYNVPASMWIGEEQAAIGCGHGHSKVLMAEAFPSSTFFGIDPHEASIVDLPEPGFALICFFDCLHALSEGGQHALGAQAGEARLADVFAEAGFAHRRLAGQTPFNLILEALA